MPDVLTKWDLSRTRQIMLRDRKYTKQQLDALEREYKRYIALCVRFREVPMPMSSVVDPMWHAHLIDTADYHAMCKALGVSYIHHYPALKEAERVACRGAYVEQTLAYYERYFGKPNRKYWPQAGDCGAGGCDGGGGGSLREGSDRSLFHGDRDESSCG